MKSSITSETKFINIITKKPYISIVNDLTVKEDLGLWEEKYSDEIK